MNRGPARTYIFACLNQLSDRCHERERERERKSERERESNREREREREQLQSRESEPYIVNIHRE